MKKFAVIVAGGVGSRMGGPVPKQFLLVWGQPVLWHTMKVFLEAYEDLFIVLVLPEEHLEKGRAVATERIMIVTGGDTRFQSVQNGLREVESRLSGGEDAVIFVHDGVRCLLTTDLVKRCGEQAMRLGSAIPVVECRDSVRMIAEAGKGELDRAGGKNTKSDGDAGKDRGDVGRSEVLDRGRVRLVQTPQTFLGSLLLPAYRTAYRDTFTDEATVVEAAGYSVHLVEGEPFNIKITLPVDLVVAEQLLRERE